MADPIRMKEFWTDTHASSATDEWATPQDIFDRINEKFRFTLDVRGSHEREGEPVLHP